ncbi:hypothetical protein D779_3105 [Imhoffiella purpurea]|uniref:Uncharacterized protein n=1 Tax=Imhoffiella purpurea TaxID=1249627 RepID=W9V3B4_9GAMM|nr:hypothetical protein D779_3105 [Imhoffiella purpurea]
MGHFVFFAEEDRLVIGSCKPYFEAAYSGEEAGDVQGLVRGIHRERNRFSLGR